MRTRRKSYFRFELTIKTNNLNFTKIKNTNRSPIRDMGARGVNNDFLKSIRRKSYQYQMDEAMICSQTHWTLVHARSYAWIGVSAVVRLMPNRTRFLDDEVLVPQGRPVLILCKKITFYSGLLKVQTRVSYNLRLFSL